MQAHVLLLMFSHSVVCDSLWPHRLQQARPPCPSPTPGAFSNSCPLSQWCHPTILILCHPLFLLPSIFPRIRVFSSELALHIRQPKYWSFSFSTSPSNGYSGLISFKIDFFQDWLVWSPCSSGDSQESSPTPQFKSINYLALSFLYGTTLTSIHDSWKKHSFDYTGLCWQSNVSAF